MLRRPQHAPPMPWAPPTPTPAHPAWPRIIAAAAVAGLFAAVWFRAGFLALGLALALGLLLKGRPDKGRASIELVAAGMLALLLAGAPTPKAPAVPQVKVPAKVEASQTDLVDQARRAWSDAYEKTIGQAGADPKEAGR